MRLKGLRVGMPVRCIHLKGDREKEWYVVPINFNKADLPEGFVLVDGFVQISEIGSTHERARGGEAPVVANHYIFLQFDEKYWKDINAEDYNIITMQTFAKEKAKEWK